MQAIHSAIHVCSQPLSSGSFRCVCVLWIFKWHGYTASIMCLPKPKHESMTFVVAGRMSATDLILLDGVRLNNIFSHENVIRSAAPCTFSHLFFTAYIQFMPRLVVLSVEFPACLDVRQPFLDSEWILAVPSNTLKVYFSTFVLLRTGVSALIVRDLRFHIIRFW